SAMTAADVVRFAELLRTLPGPVLAYCRTGTRCTSACSTRRTSIGCSLKSP
ncbi:TIGR01244 family phosphatase, partial [bacterium]|nr:TIGR01244 family phosphatase [bacterium]